MYSAIYQKPLNI